MSSLHLDSRLLHEKTAKITMIHPLYPYDSIELAVIFVYGNDFPRRMNIIIFPEALQMIFGSVGIYIGLTTFVLYIIRKQLPKQHGYHNFLY